MVNGAKYYLFGCGHWGRQLRKQLETEHYNVQAFIDNDRKKLGMLIDGCSVIAPSKLSYLTDNSSIIITPISHEDVILTQLLQMGIPRYRIITRDDWLKEFNWTPYFDNIANNAKKEQDEATTIRVLFDGQAFSLQKRGGISRYIFEIIKGMSKNDVAQIDLFKGINISELAFSGGAGGEDKYSFGCDRLPLNDYPFREMCNKELLKYYCSISAKYDIYHPTYYQDMGVSNFTRKVVTVHDMIHEIYHLDADTPLMKKKMIESADGIIAVSENTKKDLIEILGVSPEKIKVIYHGNSLNMDVNGKRIISDPYILYVGTRSEYKNFKTLARAYARSSASKEFRLACFGGGEFTCDEKQLFESLKISDKICHVSGDDNKLANAYAYAELFVYPSLYEGFGIPLLEAMHYGTPIIASNVSSIPEVGEDAVEYFNPNSEEELIEKMDELLFDESRRKNLSEKGVFREKEFSWEKASRETLEYYKTLL